MRFSDVRPFVRYVQFLTVKPGGYPAPTRAYDARLFFAVSGAGAVEIGGEPVKMAPGDALLIPGGAAYQLLGDMALRGVNFDYDGAYAALDYPIPPDRADAFRPDALHAQPAIDDVPALSAPVHVGGLHQLEAILIDMTREYRDAKVCYREKLSALMLSALIEIVRRTDAQGGAADKIDRVIAYIQTHYAQDLTNESIGQAFNYHPNYLNKQMQRSTRKTLHQYLLSWRLAKAIELLEQTDRPVGEIAEAVGFGDGCHFSRLFKQKTGFSPSAYRRK